MLDVMPAKIAIPSHGCSASGTQTDRLHGQFNLANLESDSWKGSPSLQSLHPTSAHHKRSGADVEQLLSRTEFIGHCMDRAFSHVHATAAKSAPAFASLSRRAVTKHTALSAVQQSSSRRPHDSTNDNDSSQCSESARSDTIQEPDSSYQRRDSRKRRLPGFASASDAAASGDWKWPKLFQNWKPPRYGKAQALRQCLLAVETFAHWLKHRGKGLH